MDFETRDAQEANLSTLFPSSAIETKAKLLIVIDRRSFVRGYMRLWLDTCGQEFRIIDVAEMSDELSNDLMEQASAVILNAVSSIPCTAWLEVQVLQILSRRPDMPVVLIADPCDLTLIASHVTNLSLRGFISTSSNTDLAAAALRLIVAGGSYVPQLSVQEQQNFDRTLSPLPVNSDRRSRAKLTPRERLVLDLLRQGLPNKIIAFRLGMAQSTVKVHVHNIITKLNVRNRTAAAVTLETDLVAVHNILMVPAVAPDNHPG